MLAILVAYVILLIDGSKFIKGIFNKQELKENKMSNKQSIIGIVSVSSSVAPFPKRLQRSLDELQNKGFNYVLCQHALGQDGYRVAHPREVANGVMAAFHDQAIEKILISTGGVVGNNLLEYLDYEQIAKTYKPICGFSDATPLLLAIYAKTGKVTYHGPTLLPGFGDYEGINPDTFASFQEVFIEKKPKFPLPDFPYMIASSQIWDVEDSEKLTIKEVDARSVVKAGCASGTLIGGNLNGILSLLGTNYLPDLTKSIMFIEESGTSLAQFERGMYQLKHVGVLSSISGLLVGRFTNTFMSNVKSADEIAKVLMETVSGDVPIIMDVACGHTKPQLTFPIGGWAEIKDDGSVVINQ